MAQLCDLPPELVVGIFKQLHTRQAMQDVMTSASTDKAFAMILRSSWQDRFNLSVVNRRYHKIARPLVYKTISIHKRGALRKLVSLLRFLRANPDVASSVEQLYLDIRPHSSYFQHVNPTDADTVFEASKTSTIGGIQSFWNHELERALGFRPQVPDTLKTTHECACFTTIFILLLHNMRNVHDLGIAVMPGSCSCLSHRIKEICPSSVDFFDVMNLIMETIELPEQLHDFPAFENVKAVALRSIDGMSNPFLGYQAGALLKMNPNATCFYMEGCDFIYSQLFNMGLSSITQLTIHGVKMDKYDYFTVIKSCSMLLHFKYIAKTHNKCDVGGCGPSPKRIVEMLQETGHNTTLVSLYLDYRQNGDLWRPGYPSLADFKALDSASLCFNTTPLEDSVWGSNRRPAESTLMSLPQNLRILRLWGNGWSSSALEQLFPTSAKFPNLESVDFDWEDGQVEYFRQRLRNSGIQSLNAADLTR
ncbi:hypothetical protein CkaCkLH20_10660 [Colletotrichum karsti]|uniref:Uncharacterized protein n=1 Tax=Colletotrichum karsti TaxID=1095194 RepID=A0A9P6LG18_9PEZI|nr:uncharacterized protein CkaCkLH20_10660 [Colletotrichum karsti]KAF9871726.1 hypothetical protein CkaCkLH20_10660 [Colletotrichum karsti]